LADESTFPPVADLITADGSQILDTAWEGKARLNPRSTILWPNQGKLDKGTWNQWQNALTKSLSLSRSRRLEVPLGEWIDNDDSWEWFFDPRVSVFIDEKAHPLGVSTPDLLRAEAPVKH